MSKPGFIPTELYTKLGGFVTVVDVPPFNPKPEILQWGARFFVYDAKQDKYIEGMLYWCGNDLPKNIPKFEK